MLPSRSPRCPPRCPQSQGLGWNEFWDSGPALGQNRILASASLPLRTPLAPFEDQQPDPLGPRLWASPCCGHPLRGLLCGAHRLREALSSGGPVSSKRRFVTGDGHTGLPPPPESCRPPSAPGLRTFVPFCHAVDCGAGTLKLRAHLSGPTVIFHEVRAEVTGGGDVTVVWGCVPRRRKCLCTDGSGRLAFPLP